MSVMNGFRAELINKIIGFNSHITVEPYNNEIKIDKNDKKSLNLISKNLILSNSGEAIIIYDKNSKGIVLRGYSNKDFSKLELINNNKFLGKNDNLLNNYISISKELSFTLGVKIGDNITLMSSSGVETIIGNLPKQKKFIVASLFESGLAEFDNNVAFINLNTLEEFFDYKKNSRNLEIYLKDPQNIENQKNIVQKIFPNDFVYSWSDMNKSLFSALKIERNVMFIILSLIIIVAAFNIISGLTI
jgi:ABC-type transport system, involved in lipoprotein release, permease component